MKRVMTGFLVAAALFASGVKAHALGGLALGAKIGTLGPGLELTGYVTDKFNVRGGFNFIEFGWDGSADDIDYDMDVHYESLAALIDFHPFENNFRISGGVMWNDNDIKMDGQINGSTTIGGNEYTADQIGTLTGEATFDSVVPYVGIGFGNAVMDDVDLTFSFDLGVMFQGTPDVTLAANGTAANDPQFQADLKAEEQDAQDLADNFSIYPVLSFGMAYYFW